MITRELFGYSFATWRFHLRGETIRSAADVGWIRDLTVDRLMRQDMTTAPVDMPIGEFRQRFPLGSKTQVVAVDDDGRYVGLAFTAEAHAPEIDPAKGLAGLLHHRDVVLHPAMNIREAIAVFDAAEAEALAVAEAGDEHRPIGILSEAHAMRRYAGRIRTTQAGGDRRDLRAAAVWMPSQLLILWSPYAGIFSSFCRQRLTRSSGGIGVSGKLVFQSVTPTSPI